MLLYGTLTSPYVRHCRVALLATQQAFELVTTDYDQAAQRSPTARVPFLEDGDVHLYDSTAILAHVRAKVQAPFLERATDYDLYCLANTATDAAIVLMLAERLDGLQESKSAFLTRQRARLEATLDELERRQVPADVPLADAPIRVACLLDWGLFRKRFSLESRPALRDFLGVARAWEPFAVTAPPAQAPLP